MAKKIIIMDQSTLEVHVYTLPKKHEALPEGFIISRFSSQGKTFSLQNCNWMVTEVEIELGVLPIFIH